MDGEIKLLRSWSHNLAGNGFVAQDTNHEAHGDVAGFDSEGQRWRLGHDRNLCFGMGKILAQESIFEDRYDVIKFIKLAQQHGLYIHLHIGPYNRLRLQNVHRSVKNIHIKIGPSFSDWQY